MTPPTPKKTVHDAIAAELDSLRTARDQLRVRMHLGGEDLRDLWTAAEVKWSRVEGEWKRLVDEVEAPTEEVRHGFTAMVTDMGDAYTRMRAALKREVAAGDGGPPGPNR
ncbi:MAG: hypothetical protein ACI8PZ_004362 [Myxococcota bacterium]|jgi:hypothetical protein